MEILRRLFLVLFTIAAVSTWVAPVETIFHVALPDFQQELTRSPYPWQHKGKSLDVYITEVTATRSISVPSEQFDALLAASQISRGYLSDDQAQLRKSVAQLVQQRQVVYLAQMRDGKQHYVRVRRLTPQEYLYSEAPFALRHPYSSWSPYLIGVGLLLYAVLPRRRFSADTLCYGSGFKAVIGPDLIGWGLFTLFYGLGLFIGLSGASGGLVSLLASELVVISCVLWAFALGSLYFLKLSIRYSALGLRCSDSMVTRFTAAGESSVSVDAIAGVHISEWQPSQWVTRLGLLLSFFNWRALGPVLLNASRQDFLLEVWLKDGRKWIYDLTGARNVRTVINNVQNGGVRVDEALVQYVVADN